MKQILFLILFGFVSFADLHAKTINDMLGRSVTIPENPARVYAPVPYATYALYAMDPSQLVGWIFKIDEKSLKFLHPRMKTLPVIGRVFGAGQNANLEVLLSHKPDLVLMWSHQNEFTKKEEERLGLLNTPVVYAKEESLTDYPKVFRFLGEALNRKERGEALATYTQRVLEETNLTLRTIAQSKRPKVYYAQGVDGLLTECDDSIHAELLRLVGDVNVHKCHASSHKGFEKISMETVLNYDPDVILVQEKMFFDEVYEKTLWKEIKAVQTKQVYLIPRRPFNWFDRPPSFMRILAIQWTMAHLYPKDYAIDIEKEIRKFYSLFLNVELTNEDIKALLDGN